MSESALTPAERAYQVWRAERTILTPEKQAFFAGYDAAAGRAQPIVLALTDWVLTGSDASYAALMTAYTAYQGQERS